MRSITPPASQSNYPSGRTCSPSPGWSASPPFEGDAGASAARMRSVPGVRRPARLEISGLAGRERRGVRDQCMGPWYGMEDKKSAPRFSMREEAYLEPNYRLISARRLVTRQAAAFAYLRIWQRECMRQRRRDSHPSTENAFRIAEGDADRELNPRKNARRNLGTE